MAQWTESQPVNRKVTGSIPSQGTSPICRPGPWLGACEWQAIDVSHTSVFLSLLISLPSPPSIKTSKHTKNLYLDLRLFLFIHLDPSASAHSKVVIFTVNSLGTSQSYLDVVQRNVDMFRALVPALGHYSPNSILLVASQPGKRFCLK